MNPVKRGFTLIELLIMVALIGICIPVVYNLAVDPLRIHAVESAREVQQDDFDKVHRALSKDIRSASRIVGTQNDLSSDSENLILEIPVLQEGSFEVGTIRVCYCFTKLPEKGGTASLFVRKKYDQVPEGWRLVNSYPLSREIEELQFHKDSETWEDAQTVKVGMSWKTKAVHTDLVHSATPIYALRGAL